MNDKKFINVIFSFYILFLIDTIFKTKNIEIIKFRAKNKQSIY